MVNDRPSLLAFRSCECGSDPKKACSECGGLRLVPIPEQFQPEYVSDASFDPDTLRLAAQTHADHHALSGSFTLKPWVVLYLLAVWEAAIQAAEWHGGQGQNHVTDAALYEAVTGKGWRDRG